MNSLLARFKKLFDPVDLTTGDIAKGITVFLIPILLSLFFQQIYSLTDAIIVGQNLSEAEFSGVSNSGSIVFMIMEFGLGCTAGFSVVISESIGAKNELGVKRSFFAHLVLSFIVSIVVAIVGVLTVTPLLNALGISSSAVDMEAQTRYLAAKTYLTILFAGCIAQIFYNMIVAVLRALGDSFVPFLFLVGSTILNIGLDLLFILGFKMGVAGSAAATILSQAIAAIGAILYGIKRYPVLRFHKEDIKEGVAWWRHLRNGLPLGFQFSVLAIGVVVMQGVVISFDQTPAGLIVAGVPAEVGYGAACKIINFTFLPANGLGTAMISYTSQNLGAGRIDRIKEGLKKALKIGTVFSFIVTALVFLLCINGAYQYIFLSPVKVTEQTILYGNAYLFTCAPFLWVLMALLVIRSTLQGLEKPMWPLICGIGELVARLAVCLLLPLALNAGNPIDCTASIWAYVGACLGDPAAWTISPLIAILPLLISLKKISEKKEE